MVRIGKPGAIARKCLEMSVFHLFIAIIALLVLSIVLSIINWAMQAGISARIALLEKELEKKTAEFDMLKKERIAPPVQSHPVPPDMDMATRFDIPIEPQLVNDGEIRVVRNVRGTFTPVEDDAHTFPPPRSEQATEATRIESISPVAAASRRSPQPMRPDFVPDEARGINLAPHPSTHQAQQSSRAPAPGIVIPLFNRQTGEADFNALYGNLVTALKKSSCQSIAFDCGGIQYLSDGEIEYLEKIHRSLVSQGRHLHLVHCSKELKTILFTRQELATTVS